LLFPVISITDDLSAEQSIFQATAAKKSNHFNELAKGLITALPVGTSGTPQIAWREINLHADLSGVEQQFFAFDLSRRPPPDSRREPHHGTFRIPLSRTIAMSVFACIFEPAA
jgi:hypothetical protein